MNPPNPLRGAAIAIGGLLVLAGVALATGESPGARATGSPSNPYDPAELGRHEPELDADRASRSGRRWPTDASRAAEPVGDTLAIAHLNPSPSASPSPSPSPSVQPTPSDDDVDLETPEPTESDGDNSGPGGGGGDDDEETPEPSEADDDNSGPGGGDD